MSDKYDTHADYMSWVDKEASKRQDELDKALRGTFAGFLTKKGADIIDLGAMSSEDLSKAIQSNPMVLEQQRFWYRPKCSSATTVLDMITRSRS